MSTYGKTHTMPFKIHTVYQLGLNQGKENLFQCSESNGFSKRNCLFY